MGDEDSTAGADIPTDAIARRARYVALVLAMVSVLVVGGALARYSMESREPSGSFVKVGKAVALLDVPRTMTLAGLVVVVGEPDNASGLSAIAQAAEG